MSRAYNEEGPADEFKRMRAFVSSHDMTDPANYDYIKKNIDLIGLIDYKIGQIYSGNADVGNIRYVRSTAPGSDRKWHYVFYDLDATWVGYKPSAAFYLTTGPEASEANVAYHNLMISRLLPNKEFRALFLQRLGQHLATTLSPANANKVFDDLVALIKPEMERNCKRWPQLSYNQWEKNIADFKVKLDNKPKVMLDDIRVLLSVTQEENKKYFGKLGY